MRGFTAYEIVTLLKNPVLNANRIEVGIKIIETSLIPKILYGCESWTNITKQQIDKLEKIRKDALQRIFTIPRTTSRCGLYFEDRTQNYHTKTYVVSKKDTKHT